MNNLIKTSLYLLSLALLIVSCDGKISRKGDWSSSDLKKCKYDVLSELKNDSEFEAMLPSMGVTIEEFASCVCEKIAEDFESYQIADREMEGMSDEEAGMMMISCFGDLEELASMGMESIEGEYEPDLRTVEEIVKIIREDYYVLKDIWDDLIVTKMNKQITIYSILMYPSENNHFCAKIKMNGITNEFYVKNDKLYFVFKYGNGYKDRYYFDNNEEIVRWLDKNKDDVIYENPFEEKEMLMNILNQIY